MDQYKLSIERRHKFWFKWELNGGSLIWPGTNKNSLFLIASRGSALTEKRAIKKAKEWARGYEEAQQKEQLKNEKRQRATKNIPLEDLYE